MTANINMNLKKRKYDAFDTPTNTNSNINEPNKKKTKLVEKVVGDKASDHVLTEKYSDVLQHNKDLKHNNKELRKENDHYKQSLSAYKKEISQWKWKFKKLQGQLRPNDQNNADILELDIKAEVNLNKSDNSDFDQYFNSIAKNGYITNLHNGDGSGNYDSVRDRLLGMGYDKGQIMSRISLYKGSGQSAEFVFDQLLPTFMPDIKSILPIQPPTTNNGINYNISEYQKQKKRKNGGELPSKDTKLPMDIDFSSFLTQNATLQLPKTLTLPKSLNLSQTIKLEQTHTPKSGVSVDINNSKPLTKRKHPIRNNKCKDNPYKYSNDVRYREFEDSYYVSVPCHLCEEHFGDIYKYRDHLKEHYTNDAEKTYLVCDLGCDGRRFVSSKAFTSHISSHTKDRIYHCSLIVHGAQCTHSTGLKGDMKRHWERHFNIVKPEKRYIKRKNNPNLMEFDENSFKIAAHCHICGNLFDDIKEYRDHLKAHYNSEGMEWRVCEFGCDKGKFADSKTFLAHIVTHTKERPYECNIVAKGVKCTVTSGSKGNMKIHWKKKHLIPWMKQQQRLKRKLAQKRPIQRKIQRKKFLKKTHKPIKRRSISVDKDDCEWVEFEDSYYISVNCHICSKHFSNIRIYREHLKVHYNNDMTKEWLLCDFGCERRKSLGSSESFVQHIAMHTKDRPFKCNLSIDGVKCTFGAGSKGNVKAHWRTHFKHSLENGQRNTPKKKKVYSIKKESNINIHKPTQPKIEFLDSYHIAVNCHICSKFFRDIDEYCVHLEKHYNIDPTKTWMQCDFGCDPNETFNEKDFLSHISAHTGDGPFKCDTVINGIKCHSSFGEMENLSNHWKTHYPKLRIKPKTPINPRNNGNKLRKEQRTVSIEEEKRFERAYFVSVNCHICNAYFSQIRNYRKHMREHYNTDASKRWNKCDFGCGNQYPFKCNVTESGQKCKHSSGTKSNLKAHWLKMHNRDSVNSEESSEESTSESTSESESESGSDGSCSSSMTDSDSDSESEMRGMRFDGKRNLNVKSKKETSYDFSDSESESSSMYSSDES